MKNVFITGAAAGIGRAVAENFAKQGYFVGLYDIDEAALETFHKELGEKVSCYQQCDVTDQQSIDAAFKHFAEHTDGRLDVLINNAGVLFGGPFQDITAEQHEKLIDVNIKGLTLCAHAAYDLLKATPGSCLINICSVSCIYGIPLLAAYSASKAYVKALTEALSLEWENEGIRVASVMPPFVKTSMLTGVPQVLFDKLGADCEPADIADKVGQAVGGSRLHYVISAKALLWGEVERHLPWRLRRGIVKYLTTQ